MKHITHVTRLHLNKPEIMFRTPAFIIALVLIITTIISFALQRAGLDPANPAYADGARSNIAVAYALPGFLVYYGVQAVSTTFPFALALGTTRRAYVLGTALANLILSVFVAAMLTVLLWIELATDHWFFGSYALDNYALGSGDAWVLAITVFLGTFVAVTIGGFFGAIWVRFGTKGPTIAGVVLGLIVVLILLAIAPNFIEIVTSITRVDLAVGAIVVALLALVGTWVTMRRAAVR